ncbi:hypothetical protein Q765_11290 [Flavobacterium rivuli WB 3.3-2 = DSM 21788]|uniref:Uncharacterized protein n=1 Tax=Flavobacterium rivuli WB 3.3-2 = DSM 21788 TaxID=1121895 RepID=A0A0A2MDS7_9FLAO|nr:hypothetical protein [Flavobacterium rivuli]KGO86455.1 hypothetical protein Q765_11290 [Flavobacterium rivuli WB 3.3-2 = DSM 21788]
MSNKLNSSDEVITLENYKSFIFDLGEIEITKIDFNVNPLKINFDYKGNNKVEGLLYISIINNILNRFLFILPNQKKSGVDRSSEINEIIDKLIYLKDEW